VGGCAFAFAFACGHACMTAGLFTSLCWVGVGGCVGVRLRLRLRVGMRA